MRMPGIFNIFFTYNKDVLNTLQNTNTHSGCDVTYCQY